MRLEFDVKKRNKLAKALVLWKLFKNVLLFKKIK